MKSCRAKYFTPLAPGQLGGKPGRDDECVSVERMECPVAPLFLCRTGPSEQRRRAVRVTNAAGWHHAPARDERGQRQKFTRAHRCPARGAHRADRRAARHGSGVFLVLLVKGRAGGNWRSKRLPLRSDPFVALACRAHLFCAPL
jgi:hypothetical protein